MRVSSTQAIINFIALNTPEDESEAPEITQRRRKIESAEHALDHLRSLGLPPIFTPCDFEALRKKGER
jgi:hypothetical protein